MDSGVYVVMCVCGEEEEEEGDGLGDGGRLSPSIPTSLPASQPSQPAAISSSPSLMRSELITELDWI